jgi:LPS export ABC transporter protein LptC
MTQYHYKKDKFYSALLLFGLLSLFSCKENAGDIPVFDIYDGPKATAENVHVIFSDSGFVRCIMDADTQQQLYNEDEVFPDGIDLVFFEGQDIKKSTIRSDSAYYNKIEDQWTLVGDVVVLNLAKNEKLNTELLYWSEDEERVWTTAAVKISTPDQILNGVGLDAKDDFSYYEIRNITGVLSVD